MLLPDFADYFAIILDYFNFYILFLIFSVLLYNMVCSLNTIGENLTNKIFNINYAFVTLFS